MSSFINSIISPYKGNINNYTSKDFWSIILINKPVWWIYFLAPIKYDSLNELKLLNLITGDYIKWYYPRKINIVIQVDKQLKLITTFTS